MTTFPVVGMVLDQAFPPDARVEREATALAKAGYQVHLLCLATTEQPADTPAFYEGIYLHRVHPKQVAERTTTLPLPSRWRYRGLGRNWIQRVYHIDTPWEWLISRFVDQLNIQMLHVHDLRLLSTALAVADSRDVLVVADLHENFPALMALVKGKDQRGRPEPRKAATVKARWEAVEKLGTWQADRVIVVTDAAKERLMTKGIAPQKIVVVENTVDMDKFLAAPLDPVVLRTYRSRFTLSYVGYVNGPHRGIQTVLAAIALLKWDIPDLMFVAAGGLSETYHRQLTGMVEAMGLSAFVTFTGWVDENEFASYIYASDVCVCPHLANDHTNATFPNKLYLYNLFAKPVIASDCLPIQAYMASSGGGVIFESGNAEALAHYIRQLYHDPARRRQLGEAGRHAVINRFNWACTAPKLLNLYEELTQSLTG